jgi:hypothetical protein
MKTILIAALLLGLASVPVMAKPADWTEDDWVKFVEEAVQIGLGDALSKTDSSVPLGDVYAALSSLDGSTEAGLHTYLQSKMREAADNNDTDRLDKYQAYDTCLMTADCSRLQQYAASQPLGTTASCQEETDKQIEQPITAEASTIHAVLCAAGEFYIYEYVKPYRFRVIKPGDWAHAIGGRDVSTMVEAMTIAGEAFAASADDCRAIWTKQLDIKNAGQIEDDRAMRYVAALDAAKMPAAGAKDGVVTRSEFMAACQKDVFKNIK